SEDGKPVRVAKSAGLSVKETSPDRVAFTLDFELEGPGARKMTCSYAIDANGVTCEQSASAGDRFAFPLLGNDGAKDTTVKVADGSLNVSRQGGSMMIHVIAPHGIKLQPTGPRVPTHNGYVQAYVAPLPQDAGSVQYLMTLSPK